MAVDVTRPSFCSLATRNPSQGGFTVLARPHALHFRQRQRVRLRANLGYHCASVRGEGMCLFLIDSEQHAGRRATMAFDWGNGRTRKLTDPRRPIRPHTDGLQQPTQAEQTGVEHQQTSCLGQGVVQSRTGQCPNFLDQTGRRYQARRGQQNP